MAARRLAARGHQYGSRHGWCPPRWHPAHLPSGRAGRNRSRPGHCSRQSGASPCHSSAPRQHRCRPTASRGGLPATRECEAPSTQRVGSALHATRPSQSSRCASIAAHLPCAATRDRHHKQHKPHRCLALALQPEVAQSRAPTHTAAAHHRCPTKWRRCPSLGTPLGHADRCQ
jgi:hypothetical protein